MLSGAFAGLAGAFLAVEVNEQLARGPDAGPRVHRARRPDPVELEPEAADVAAALIFGFAQAIPLRLDDAPIIRLLPPEFIRMIPYVVTIVAHRRVRREGQTAGRGGQGVRGRLGGSSWL